MADIAFSCFTLAIWSHCCRLGDQLFGCKVNIIYQDRTQIQRSGHTVVDQLFGCISIAKLPRWNPNVAGAKNRF